MSTALATNQRLSAGGLKSTFPSLSFRNILLAGLLFAMERALMADAPLDMPPAGRTDRVAADENARPAFYVGDRSRGRQAVDLGDGGPGRDSGYAAGARLKPTYRWDGSLRRPGYAAGAASSKPGLKSMDFVPVGGSDASGATDDSAEPGTYSSSALVESLRRNVRPNNFTSLGSSMPAALSTAGIRQEYRRLRNSLDGLGAGLEANDFGMNAAGPGPRRSAASAVKLYGAGNPTGQIDPFRINAAMGIGSAALLPGAPLSKGSAVYKAGAAADSLQGGAPQPPASSSGLILPKGYNDRTEAGIITDLSSMPGSLVLANNTVLAPSSDPAALGNSAPQTASLSGAGTLEDTIIPWNINAYIAADWSNLGQICSTPSVNNSKWNCLAYGLVSYDAGGLVWGGQHPNLLRQGRGQAGRRMVHH